MKEVCGTDGVTYQSQCFLDFATCKNNDITKKSDGPCPPGKSKKLAEFNLYNTFQKSLFSSDNLFIAAF